jgi:hypothetical protein
LLFISILTALVLLRVESRASESSYFKAICTGTIQEKRGMMIPTMQLNIIALSEGLLGIEALTFFSI